MELERISILDFQDYRQYLRTLLEVKSRRQPGFSLRAFARLAGVSPSHLSRTLNGQKCLSASSARQISMALNQSQAETSHFLSLVDLERAKTSEDQNRLLRRLAQRRGPQSQIVSLESFKAIADWYHFAIVALAQTKNFRTESSWIARRLGIKAMEARFAVERLLSLGLLERRGDKIKAKNDAHISTTDDLSSLAIQENHRQHLQMASRALSEIPVEQREFNNMSMSIKMRDVPRAKKAVRDFFEQFDQEFSSPTGDEVFQFNVQFYRLTQILDSDSSGSKGES